MARPLNFAVVGLGMGMHHCKAIANAKGAQLAAVCDIDKERLAPAAKDYDCKAYARFADVLKDKEIDVVCIATESGTHAKLGIAAAKAGKHLIVEKPVDISPAAVTRLQKAVAQAGVKCGCIFQSRMSNMNILIRKALDKGHLGQLIGAHACTPWYRAQSYYEGPHGSWKGTWKLDGGGSLMNQGIHDLDLLTWLAGSVDSVCGFFAVCNHTIETEDQTVAVLKFANGALGTLYTTTCCNPDAPRRLFLYGTKGRFCKNDDGLESYDMGPKKQRERMMALFGGEKEQSAVSHDPMAVSADGHMLICEDLVKAVRKDRDPAITLESARHAVDVACAIYKSGKTGKEVKINSVRK